MTRSLSIQSFSAVLQNALMRFKTKNNCRFLVSIASLSLAENQKPTRLKKVQVSCQEFKNRFETRKRDNLRNGLDRLQSEANIFVTINSLETIWIWIAGPPLFDRAPGLTTHDKLADVFGRDRERGDRAMIAGYDGPGPGRQPEIAAPKKIERPDNLPDLSCAQAPA